MESVMPYKLCPMTLSILLAWSLVSFFPICSQADEPLAKESLIQRLTLASGLKEWKLDGEPQAAEGIRLFELINGGAEIYVKEGFRRAVIATYRNNQGKRINLEIYEMLSPESASRVHRKKAGDKGKKVSVGEEATIEDYYLNFREGVYQVTLSGDDTQRETMEGILDMARLVAARISAFQPRQ